MDTGILGSVLCFYHPSSECTHWILLNIFFENEKLYLKHTLEKILKHFPVLKCMKSWNVYLKFVLLTNYCGKWKSQWFVGQ